MAADPQLSPLPSASLWADWGGLGQQARETSAESWV